MRQFRDIVGAGDDWDILAASDIAPAAGRPLDLEDADALRGLRDSALRAGFFEIEPRWRRLIETSLRLEVLARKQLEGRPFDGSDRTFLESYGATIAGIMLYDSNSYLSPRDDAPRVADVHYNPNDPERPYLHAGTARPRALYVLYPGKNGEYLCRGAVLPYYEFRSQERLTDAAWTALLDGEDRPGLPSWIAPIAAEGGLRKPKLSRH